jgi:transcriptional regulator with XRE-family HTH domain
MVEILCGEDWEHSEDISTVPREHWKWFLGAHVGNWRVKKIAGTAKPLIANLRILHGNEGWKELGLSSWSEALEFFGLDETKWQWLQAGEPVLLDSDSVEQGEAKGRSRLAAEMVLAEGITQAEAAERVGISQQAVSKAMNTTESCESQKVVVPDHLHGDHEKADFRKLSPEGQERVRQGEALNRVALAEGVRRRSSPLEQAQKAFRRLTKEDRDAFDSWRGGLEL